MLEPELVFDTNRGVPLSPVQQVCIALNHYSGQGLIQVSKFSAIVASLGTIVSNYSEFFLKHKTGFQISHILDSTLIQEGTSKGSQACAGVFPKMLPDML